jgi:hypothetical protein
VFDAIGKVAADGRMSGPALVESLLAREVARLDPPCGRFRVGWKNDQRR